MIEIPWHNEPVEYFAALFLLFSVVGSGLLAANGLGALMPALIPARAFRRVFGVGVMAALVAEALYLVFYPGGQYYNHGIMGAVYGFVVLLAAWALGGTLALVGRRGAQRHSR